MQLYASSAAHFSHACECIEQEIQRIEWKYSRFRPDSFLSEINRIALRGGQVCLDDETAQLIDYAYACHHKSGGLFDLTIGPLAALWQLKNGQPIPERQCIQLTRSRIGMDKMLWQRPQLIFNTTELTLDLGGLAKEYAADRAAEVCRDLQIAHGLIELGGDLSLVGPHPDGTPWQVGIQHPENADALLGRCVATAGGIATSGNYERFVARDGKRYGHLINPLTGWPAEGLTSVTVQAQSCLLAGSLSSIALLQGRAGIHWLDAASVPYLAADTDGNLYGPLAGT